MVALITLQEIAVRAGNHGMRTLKSTEEGTEKVVADEKGYAVPVSYTHLTLPTT